MSDKSSSPKSSRKASILVKSEVNSVKGKEGESKVKEARQNFKALMMNPTAKYFYEQYLRVEDLHHLLQFWVDVERFQTCASPEQRASQAETIFYTYIDKELEGIPVTKRKREAIRKKLKDPDTEIFRPIQKTVFNTLFYDSYGRFMYVVLQRKAQRNLKTSSGGEGGDFIGLGDCFCLTDPSLPDNPIVAASDGFVVVTGYPRSAIIPHNCRFLQGEATTPETSRRIGQRVREGKEVTEFLLNYKLDGTPFWNLLYICPLKNEKGETVFFLGGQVDVTKTINHNSPLKEIISCMESSYLNERPPTELSTLLASSKGKEKAEDGIGFKKFFRKFVGGFDQRRNRSLASPRAEESVVKMELNPEKQKDFFLSTYANFVVLDGRDKFGHILFTSPSFSDLTGWMQEDVIGKPFNTLFTQESSQKTRISDLKLAMKKGKAFSQELQCVDSANEVHLATVYLTPVKDVNNEPRLFILIMKWKQDDDE